MAVEHPTGTIRQLVTESGPATRRRPRKSITLPRSRQASIDPRRRARKNAEFDGVEESAAFFPQIRPRWDMVFPGSATGLPRSLSVFRPSHSFRDLPRFFALRPVSRPGASRLRATSNFDIVRRGFVTCRHSLSNPFFCHEEDLPTQGSKAKAPSRLPSSHADPGRAQHRQSAPAQRSEASRCLTSNPFAPPGTSGGC